MSPKKKLTTKDKIITHIQHLTNHKYVVLTNRCNMALFYAFLGVKAIQDPQNPNTKILTVDQGGWKSYYKLPMLAGFDIEEFPTSQGHIRSGMLKDYLLNRRGNAAFLFHSLAGYVMREDCHAIHTACQSTKTVCIADISGSIGDPSLTDWTSDIYVCSFGDHKIVNVGYGGFISTNNPKIHEAIKQVTLIDKIYDNTTLFKKIYQGLTNAPKRYELLQKAVAKVEDDLSLHYILHSGKGGINSIICFVDENEKNQIIRYAKNKGFEYILCPQKHKLDVDAISIEIKRKSDKELKEFLKQ